MEFTENWTKKDNDYLRSLIKEGRSSTEIIEIIGYEKLRMNPKKKYVGKFNEFILNEIFARPKETIFSIKQEKSKYYTNEINYYSPFKTDSGQEYIIDFIYVKEENQFKNDNVFNLSFTTKENRDLINHKKYETETDKNEIIELTKRLIYVIEKSIGFISLNYNKIVLLIGETEHPTKIKFYRNIIKDSLPEYEEIEDVSSFTNGLKSYYFKKVKK